ncbi:hypothetical protein HDU85_005491 [Gaertneriomyces sp. JEL0708]|nr:hypothetical protein HDU85_005491 [Gaertneriomyces sp. JEL0708]
MQLLDGISACVEGLDDTVIAALRTKNFDCKDVTECHEDDLDEKLRDLGVSSFGLRRKLLRAIVMFRKASAVPTQGFIGEAKPPTVSVHLPSPFVDDVASKEQAATELGCSRKRPMSIALKDDTVENSTELPAGKRRRVTPDFIGPVRTSITKPATKSQLADFSDRKELALKVGHLDPVGYSFAEDGVDSADLIVETDNHLSAAESDDVEDTESHDEDESVLGDEEGADVETRDDSGCAQTLRLGGEASFPAEDTDGQDVILIENETDDDGIAYADVCSSSAISTSGTSLSSSSEPFNEHGVIVID